MKDRIGQMKGFGCLFRDSQGFCVEIKRLVGAVSVPLFGALTSLLLLSLQLPVISSVLEHLIIAPLNLFPLGNSRFHKSSMSQPQLPRFSVHEDDDDVVRQGALLR